MSRSPVFQMKALATGLWEGQTCFLVPVNISEASFEMSENAFPSSLANFISLTLGRLTVSFFFSFFEFVLKVLLMRNS